MQFQTSLAVLCSTVLMSLSAVAADAPVEQVVVKSVAHFDFNAESIDDGDRDALLAEVGKLKDVTWQTVTATGHTDSVGSARYNQRLSARRAAAVKSYLVGKGLSASMITATGKASENPVAPNSTQDGRAQNRRTDIEFRGIRAAAN